MPWKIINISQNYLWIWVKYLATDEEIEEYFNHRVCKILVWETYRHLEPCNNKLSRILRFYEMLPNFQGKYFKWVSGLTSFHFLKYRILIDVEQKTIPMNKQNSQDHIQKLFPQSQMEEYISFKCPYHSKMFCDNWKTAHPKLVQDNKLTKRRHGL